MTIATLSSRTFNQPVSQAKKDALAVPAVAEIDFEPERGNTDFRDVDF